ncbi:hypothetical protein M513_13550 [Trichuris suis]|uniref:Uncharacterized protein n=1 Tax=Trichuris suis TaxID=68888 RepID=A0A085LKS6_9BILA|nr:hypothetical protein M513_13550 [Trichuris suis]
METDKIRDSWNDDPETMLPLRLAKTYPRLLDMALSSGRNKQSGPATRRRSRVSAADSDGCPGIRAQLILL